jgi:hypothetical protein
MCRFFSKTPLGITFDADFCRLALTLMPFCRFGINFNAVFSFVNYGLFSLASHLTPIFAVWHKL